MRRSSPIRASVPRSCRSATACSSPRGAADRRDRRSRVRVRLFAIQRELAGTREVALELADGADVEAAWAALVARHPVLAPGRDVAPLRPERRLCRRRRRAGRRRRGRDDPAGVRGAAATPQPRRPSPAASSSCARRRSRPRSWPSSPMRLASPRTARSSAFLGRTRSTPGTPGAGPGGGGRPARRSRRRVARVRGARHDGPARSSPTSPTRSRDRFGVERLAIVHRIGEVPLGEPSIAVVAVAPHRDAAFDAARYAIDETKARAPIWKAERFADGHVWIGHQARPRPGNVRRTPRRPPRQPPGRPRSIREGLPERRHGGHRRGQPPATRRPAATFAIRRPSS